MPPSDPKRLSRLAVAAFVAAFGVAFAVAYVGSLVASAIAGLVVLAAGMRFAWVAPGPATDGSRRRFLAGLSALGIGSVAAGSAIGRMALRLSRDDPQPTLEAMARSIGSEALLRVKRGYYPGRSGEIQLVLAPFNTSNYANESTNLFPRDPRSSHALSWGYTDRVPIAVYAPGIVTRPETRDEPVTLADLAPSVGQLIGFPFVTKEGEPLPALPTPARRPKVVLTYVIDGGGWNVLTHWRDAWPNLRRLMRRSLVYRNAFMGSFPTVTATAHVTIGTGAFPRTHGVSGHYLRRNGEIQQAYGDDGHADPSVIVAPTLADAWSEETGNRAWIGEIGYQIWHLGMIGRGGRRPVAVYWDEDKSDWFPQNPDLYRLPAAVPPRSELTRRFTEYFKGGTPRFPVPGIDDVCCSPPIVQHQGDLIAQTLANEPVGEDDVTDLLYINYKAPDYTGHVFNFLRPEERAVLLAVDQELGRLVRILERRFLPGEFVLIVTADHGQCPLVDTAGGVRLDPVQLQDDLNHRFGRSLWSLVQDVRPSEVFLNSRSLWDVGASLEDVAASLAHYRYGDNLGPYVPPNAIDRGRRNDPEFAAVFPRPFIEGLTDGTIARAGSGRYPDADPGPPPRLW